MSKDKNTIRDKLSRAVSYILGRTPRRETVELYSKATKPRTGQTSSIKHLEERVTKTVPIDKLEKLYRLDFLCFRIVNDYIDNIVGPGFFLDGDPEVVKELNEWAEQVHLKRVLEDVVRDIFLAGNAWVELGYTEDGKDILKLRVLNPRTMDYKRKEGENYVELDEQGEPVGYVRKEGYGMEKIVWTKDKIIVGEEEYTVPEGQDGRDRIAHFKLWSLGETYLGLTPLEPVYRQGIIRLNISRNVGESAYRSEGLIITVGDENFNPTNEQLDKIVEEFEDIESNVIFGFKYSPRVTVERLPSPELRGREDLLYYFADAFATGLGEPLSLLMEPKTGREAGVEAKHIEYENKILALQDRLAEQIRDKLFYRYMRARGIDTSKLKRVIFRNNMSATKLAKARRIATLARRGLIRYDPELEKRLRETEDLPTQLLDRQLDEWIHSDRIPEDTKEIEVRHSKSRRKKRKKD